MVDSGDNRNPFKGPFKGKGANARALRELEAELAELHAEMRQLVERFNDQFRAPRPVSLRILGRRMNPLLWWRMPGSSGTYIKLFDSEEGARILDALMPQTQLILVEYDKARIRLNFRSAVVGVAANSYRRRERELALLDQFQAKLKG